MQLTSSEIIDAIFHHLDEDTHTNRDALRNLRCVNKRLAVRATPKVFETVPLWTSLASMQNMTNICEHEHLYVFYNNLDSFD